MSILTEADALINGERHDQYGDVNVVFQRYANGWSEIIGAPVSPEQVALCMMWLKMMREKNKPNQDNRRDIAGYDGLLDQLAEHRRVFGPDAELDPIEEWRGLVKEWRAITQEATLEH